MSGSYATTLAANILICLILAGPHSSSAVAKQQQKQQQVHSSNQDSPPQQAAATQVSQSSALSNNLTNHYISSQAQKFRVNVSNLCDRNQMRATIRLNRPFYGLIHTKDKRRKSNCLVEGNGEQLYTLEVSFTQIQSEPSYCGVVAHRNNQSPSNQTLQQTTANNQSQQQTLSVVLVVRLHKSIECSDDRYFLLSCANRCTRPDCSSSSSQSAAAAAPAISKQQQGVTGSGSQRLRSFVASESIVSPVLKHSVGLFEQTGRLLKDEQWLTNNERNNCDNSMLGLKFKWLLKLCWLLGSLLAIFFCVAFCLCSANAKPFRARKGSFNNTTKRQRLAIRNKKPAGNAAYVERGLQSRGSEESSNWSRSGDAIDKMHEENSFLANQHQQLILAELFAANKRENEPDFNNNNINSNPENAAILGRASGSHLLAQTVALAQVRRSLPRRRSIGSSSCVGQENLAELTMQQQSSQFQLNGSHNNQSRQSMPLNRAKSRSQTTIHYEQSQDPFKAMPFNYMSSGYLSDGANMPQMANNSSGRLEPYLGLYQMDANQLQQRSWSQGFSGKPAAPPPPPLPLVQGAAAGNQLETAFKTNFHRGEQRSQVCSSQFDPSRHLIDLIQHKHRQQISQANNTSAATIQSAEFLADLSRQQKQTWR